MGGEWSGRRLTVPHRANLRPTAGRVKAAIFSILDSIRMKRGLEPGLSGWRCLDLYAGVGGLGLEALSRGAEFTCFVERDRAQIQALDANVQTFQCADRARVCTGDAMRGASLWEKFAPFDLVFLDPPYDLEHAERALLVLAQTTLRPGAVVIFEHKPGLEIVLPPGWTLQSERKLGPAGLSVLLPPG